jgi:hypothetical protein
MENSVTEVGIRYGFFNLGRFAADYRELLRTTRHRRCRASRVRLRNKMCWPTLRSRGPPPPRKLRRTKQRESAT